jgi:hypothetical protein
MPKLNAENAAIYIFIAFVTVMLILAFYGYLSGAWETAQ